MDTIREAINLVRKLEPATTWLKARDSIEREHDHALRLSLDENNFVYGANSLTGHKEDARFMPSGNSGIHERILREHAIGGPPYMPPEAARFVGYARLYTWSNGGSGISPRIFDLAQSAVTDTNFLPRVPLQASYSCGDVIPAAHWSVDLLSSIRENRPIELTPPDLMGLINGAFVPIGYSLYLFKTLQQSFEQVMTATRMIHDIIGVDVSQITQVENLGSTQSNKAILTYLEAYMSSSEDLSERQHPISIRSFPQVMGAFTQAVEELALEVDERLSTPSCNPFFTVNESRQFSQASFMTPKLAIRIGSCIEAALLLAWLIVNRTQYMLSGQIPGVPQDMQISQQSVGLIQYPKLMMAKLEEMRLQSGRRIFASGAQTSYGTEDLWTNSLNSARQLESTVDTLIDISAIELSILARVPGRHQDSDLLGDDPCSERIRSHFGNTMAEGIITEEGKLFPLYTED